MSRFHENTGARGASRRDDGHGPHSCHSSATDHAPARLDAAQRRHMARGGFAVQEAQGSDIAEPRESARRGAAPESA